jgi:hypothetical protein
VDGLSRARFLCRCSPRNPASRVLHRCTAQWCVDVSLVSMRQLVTASSTLVHCQGWCHPAPVGLAHTHIAGAECDVGNGGRSVTAVDVWLEATQSCIRAEHRSADQWCADLRHGYQGRSWSPPAAHRCTVKAGATLHLWGWHAHTAGAGCCVGSVLCKGSVHVASGHNSGALKYC